MVEGGMLVRAVGSLRMKDVVWEPRVERLGWSAERLMVDAKSMTWTRHSLCNLASCSQSVMVKVAGVETPQQLRKLVAVRVTTG